MYSSSVWVRTETLHCEVHTLLTVELIHGQDIIVVYACLVLPLVVGVHHRVVDGTMEENMSTMKGPELYL